MLVEALEPRCLLSAAVAPAMSVAWLGRDGFASINGGAFAQLMQPDERRRQDSPRIGSTAPSAPSTLSAVAASATRVAIRFRDNSSNETGFVVERATAGAEFHVVATLAARSGTGVRRWTDATVSPATKYFYRIEAINGDSASAWAGPIAVATPALPPPPPTDVRNLLFFGNSFTLNYNVPALVADLAVVDGHARPNVFVQGGFGWTLADDLKKIAADGANNIIDASLPTGERWDDVIIQEYSTRSASVRSRPVKGDPAGFRADSAALFKLVVEQSEKAHAILFETWARGAENLFYPGSYPNPAAMQADVLANYRAAARDLNAKAAGSVEVAKVGEAWKAQNFARDLYSGPDEYHPSRKGSLLAAMVLYRTTYHDDLSDVPAAKVTALLTADGLAAADWQQLTAVADHV